MPLPGSVNAFRVPLWPSLFITVEWRRSICAVPIIFGDYYGNDQGADGP